MLPLVSIVIPVFNGLPHLKPLTDSLLAQTYPNIEIIFSEGGGTDGSWSFLESLSDSRVRCIQHSVGTGAAQNWTFATQAAQGEFIKLVCQDDLLEPDAVAKQVADLSGHPTAVMAIAQRNIIDVTGKCLYANRGCQGFPAGLYPGHKIVRACYTHGTNIIGEPLAVLFMRQALLDAMPWNDDNPLVLDLSCYERVADFGDVVVRRESIGSFRVSTSSWSTRLARWQLEQYQLWQKHYEHAQQPSAKEKRAASRGVYRQTILRRGAYSWLKFRGKLISSETVESG